MLKSQFLVEAIIIFVKSIKKRHQVVYSLYTKASNTVCYKFTLEYSKQLYLNVYRFYL